MLFKDKGARWIPRRPPMRPYMALDAAQRQPYVATCGLSVLPDAPYVIRRGGRLRPERFELDFRALIS